MRFKAEQKYVPLVGVASFILPTVIGVDEYRRVSYFSMRSNDVLNYKYHKCQMCKWRTQRDRLYRRDECEMYIHMHFSFRRSFVVYLSTRALPRQGILCRGSAPKVVLAYSMTVRNWFRSTTRHPVVNARVYLYVRWSDSARVQLWYYINIIIELRSASVSYSCCW